MLALVELQVQLELELVLVARAEPLLPIGPIKMERLVLLVERLLHRPS